MLPRVREAVNGVNYLERLWAYLTIRDLLERVARGDISSCPPAISRPKRQIEDDEDYDEGSGSETDEYYYVEPVNVEDAIGDDEDLVICDNIERALYLSLKYEFVTPLTSLVVVGPDDPQEGDLSEAMGQHRKKVSFHGGNSRTTPSYFLLISILCIRFKLETRSLV